MYVIQFESRRPVHTATVVHRAAAAADRGCRDVAQATTMQLQAGCVTNSGGSWLPEASQHRETAGRRRRQLFEWEPFLGSSQARRKLLSQRTAAHQRHRHEGSSSVQRSYGGSSAVRSSQAGQAASAAQALELGSLRDADQQLFVNRVGALRGQIPDSIATETM